MKRQLLSFSKLTLLIVLVLMGSGCEEEANIPLLGIWKCKGFYTSNPESFKQIMPEDCKSCYTLELKSNGTVAGQTSTNEVMGFYEVNPSLKQISFTNFGGTEINELFDGRQYVEAILQVHSYQINDLGELLLFYANESQYLLFVAD
ncbi:hypothetical protein [Carboxylicivirga sp. M1479]|uniref:hypothetical protein n=1 Tax=Carboxylicivirga sp. M1479 TaxID=2594476 RepID=UPI0011781493|nr:hypothetical protein [Carboxylicivirga sp. M1479]TRX72187.1 hypothetical protein FNN09_02105 [Carboxylicivirga sp. M1479]